MAASHKKAAAEALRVFNSVLLGDQYTMTTFNALPSFFSTALGIVLVNSVVGSYGLNVWDTMDPIRCSITGTPSENTFYRLARGRFLRDGAALLTILDSEKRPSIHFELGIEGIRFVLQYHQVPYTTSGHISDVSPLYFTPAIATPERMKTLYDTAYIRRQIHDESVFRTAYMNIKKWARLHGIYSEEFRYLTEAKLLLMVAMVYSRAVEVTSEQLIRAFFDHWRGAVPNKVYEFSSAHRSATPGIESDYRPSIRFTDFTTTSTMRTIKNCLNSEYISHFSKTFDSSNMQALSLSADGFEDFKEKNKVCIKIDIQYWGPSRIERARFFQDVHSAVADFCIALDHPQSSFPDFRAWPERLRDTRVDTGQEGAALLHHACYLLGFGDLTNLSTTQEVPERLRSSVRSSHFYDPKVAFVDVVEDTSVEKTFYILDTRSWPLVPRESNADYSDEEDEGPTAVDPVRKSKANRKAKGKQNDHCMKPPEPQAKLRPAVDVLNRILHDTSLDTDDYTIGYLDRHAGILEMPVTKWKIKDATDEEFIPQSRIRHFKLNGDVVWDREERVDTVFGSGATSMKLNS